MPFATAKDVVDIAIEAEQLGYCNVAGNDHLSTRQYVRNAWPTPPDYFEPLVTLSNIAARVSFDARMRSSQRARCRWRSSRSGSSPRFIRCGHSSTTVTSAPASPPR
ncbi:hypothetical protein ACW2Q0_20920 [Nocardia sp. R16R-3T]